MKTEMANHFFTSFKNHDSEKMSECYAENAVFEDPAFGVLKGEEIGQMWKMLMSNSTELSIEFEIINDKSSPILIRWETHYPFSKTGRMVHNKVETEMWVEDGEIVKQVDSFSLWQWSKQALGLTGWLIGWTPFFKAKFNSQTRKMLTKYVSKD